MKVNETVRRAGAITIATTLGLLALMPADPAAQEVTVMRHASEASPSYGRLMLEVWNDGTNVQVVGLDTQGRIVLAREGTMNTEPTLEGTGAVEGMLPAKRFSFDSHGTIEHERCTTPSCAQAIATMAESIVRAATMGPVEGASEHVSGHTVMARLCPSTGADDANAPEPNASIAALAANTPCRWQPIRVEELAAMPYWGPEGQVQIGGARYDLREAQWATRPDGG